MSDWFEKVRQLNEKYALMIDGPYSGKIAVLSDPREPVMITQSALHLMLKPHKVVPPATEENPNPTPIPVAALWLGWEGRRELTGLEFCPPGGRDPDPFKHNLWQGFAAEPEEGKEHQKFLLHLKVNVCNGDADLYHWLVNWLADMVQCPGRKRAVGVCLYSPEFGTGKSVVYAHLKKIFGTHAYSAKSTREITGNFNAHLAGNVCLGVEEAMWSGDKEAESKLRHFMSSETMGLEMKGVNICQIDSFSRVISTSNHDWAVPVRLGDRRWLVLQVDPRRKDDREYWTPIWDALNFGKAANHLLYYLMNHVEVDEDLLFRPPMTGAKAKQAGETLANDGKWWLAVLEGHRDPHVLPSGAQVIEHGGEDGVFNAESSKEGIYENYKSYAKDQRYGEVLGERSFWRRFWEMVPDNTSQRKLKGDRGRLVWLPDRKICQDFFARTIHKDTTWDDLAA